MSNGLAIELRKKTQKAHTAAENVGFMKCFVNGVVDRDCFAKFLGNLYFVYGELEAAVQKHQNHPIVSKIYFPELNRKANLEKDLEFYYGKNWRQKITPSPTTKSYVNHIRKLSASSPELLIGHTYTRYMGDLSGGQMLQKVAQSTLKLEGYQGTSFYHFEQIPDKKAFKNKYREALDALPIDDTTRDKIVTEANYAFSLNMQIIQELEAILIHAIGEITFKKLTSHHSSGSTEMSQK
ncbi:heme oxygenase (biliverdin-producing) [Mastigocoleus sp. MO_188.B34]|uniref:biliverdin-producing heme oxygenase n=1 Tax=Mastigocoleus sp. MO_188.B34 TaxID=3036635 RepID=UPI002610AA99|nr:heme oxygenase (biliverdin-producing) [Mastigocoleus sp. MO_188.B34]MDJ0697996.1 heme oxygenase (biliverdin-producing) [Mastigocoleus sp. MO_188.B34]